MATTILGEHCKTMTCIWNREPLHPGPVSLVIFEAAANQSSIPLLAAAASGSQQVVLELGDLSQFIELHSARDLVTYDAARLHWMAVDLFRRDAAEALQTLWAFSRESRLIDLVLLDELTALAVGEARQPCGDFAEFAAERFGLEAPSIGSVSQRLLRAGQRGALGSLDLQLLHDMVAVAETQLRIHAALMDRVQQIVAQLEPPDVSRYGPLGLGLEVQAAIALHRTEGLVRVDEEALEGVIAEQRQRFWHHARILRQRGESRNCFSMPDEHADEPALGFRSDTRFRAFLDECSSEILDSYDLPVLKPVGYDGKLSKVPTHWGRLCNCHPGLNSWNECHAASRCIRFLRQIRQESLLPAYDSLPRLMASVSAGSGRHANLGDLTDAGLLRPPPRHAFIIAKFTGLETAALATICERRFQSSRIAEILRAKGDPIAMAADAWGGMPGDRPPTQQGDDRETLNRTLAVVLETISLRLAPENARWIANCKYQLELAPVAARAVQMHLFREFPELQQYFAADDTIEAFAANLNFFVANLDMAPRRVQRYLEAGENLTAADLRRALLSPSKNLLRRFPGPEVDPELSQIICKGAYLPQPVADVFKRVIVSPAGLVRLNDHFSELTAEYLVLVDHALKAALYAISAQCLKIAGCTNHEIAVAVADDHRVEEAASHVAALAREAAAGVMDGIPTACRGELRSEW